MQTAISKLKRKSVSPDRECGVPEHLLCVLLGLEHQVGAERRLVRGEAPDPEVVHGLDPRHGQQRVPHTGVAGAGGRGLHDDGQGVPQDGHGGPQHQETEHKRADRVHDGPLGLEVDHKRRYQHS